MTPWDKVVPQVDIDWTGAGVEKDIVIRVRRASNGLSWLLLLLLLVSLRSFRYRTQG